MVEPPTGSGSRSVFKISILQISNKNILISVAILLFFLYSYHSSKICDKPLSQYNTSSVSAMLNHLQLPTLEPRRNLNRITMLYKITNNLIAVDPKLYLTPQPYLSTRNNNPLQYQIISTRTNYYKYSFFPHAVLWNSLPYTVVNAGPLDQF